MNPGLSEEAGRTSRHIVAAFRDQPLVLALLLINILFLGLVAWGVRDARQQQNAMISNLIEKVAACPFSLAPLPK